MELQSIKIEITLRGKRVEVWAELEMLPTESMANLSEQLFDMRVVDEHGVCDWQLTHEERRQVERAYHWPAFHAEEARDDVRDLDEDIIDSYEDTFMGLTSPAPMSTLQYI